MGLAELISQAKMGIVDGLISGSGFDYEVLPAGCVTHRPEEES